MRKYTKYVFITKCGKLVKIGCHLTVNFFSSFNSYTNTSSRIFQCGLLKNRGKHGLAQQKPTVYIIGGLHVHSVEGF